MALLKEFLIPTSRYFPYGSQQKPLPWRTARQLEHMTMISRSSLSFSVFQTGPSLHPRPFLLYSTSPPVAVKPPHFLVDYLVDTLNFSKEEARTTSNKVSGRLESLNRPSSVVNLFKDLGFKQSQIKSIVFWWPNALAFSELDETIIPKIRVFQELGLSGSDLGSVIAADPSILSRRLDSHILPLIEFLKSVTGSNENVIKTMKRSNIILTCSIEKRMRPNMKLLESYGISGEKLGKLVVKSPRNLLYRTKFLEEVLMSLERKWGFSRESTMFLHGLDSLASISQEMVDMKFRVFKSYGWTESDIILMVRNLPYCIKLSDAKIRTGLDFFMGKLKYEPKQIASQPKLMMYSLEKRILPRMKVFEALKEKQLIKRNPSLYSVVQMTEVKFLDKYLLPYKEELGEPYDDYINSRRDGSQTVD